MNNNPSQQTKLFGWSNTNFSYSDVVWPESMDIVRATIKAALKLNKKIIACGSGLSYGDEALNNGNIVVNMSKMNQIIGLDHASGILKVESGATLDQVLMYCLESNWTLATIPGTRFVTMGGALANNVHGKNCYAKGNFGDWVREFKIILASGDCMTCSKLENSDIFFAAIGGAGLLGIVVEITLQLIKIPSPYLSVRKSTSPSLNEILDDLDEEDKKNDYVIAQLDCFPKYNAGRGTIHSGSFIKSPLNPDDLVKMRKINPMIFGIFPKKLIPIIGKYILNDFVMRLVSGLKYHLDKITTSEKTNKQDIYEFTFFLDKVPDWKQVFRNGFYEYEPLIPKEKAREVIPELIALTHKYKMPAYLSAIKIHRRDDFLISYSMDGYSFAMDIPRRYWRKNKQDELFRKMNKIVIEAGGIIYLAKDASLTSSEFRQMYKNIDKFFELKNKYDPEELFQSDMYRRIFK